MEDILKSFHKDFRRDIDGVKLCRELELRSLVIRDDTELVIARTKESKLNGNEELYNIICRKIIHPEDLLLAFVEVGHFELAQKIYDNKKEYLQSDFVLPSHDKKETCSTPEKNITIINALNVSLNMRDHNTINIPTNNAQLNKLNPSSIEEDNYTLED